MKTLDLVGDDKFKIADTGTMMSYYATDNNSKVPFTKDDTIVFKIRNSDGYVMEVPGIVSGGGYWINLDSSKLKALPPATYEVEMWATDKSGTTDIYPDDSFVPFTITNNATIVTSDSLSLISLDEYEAKLKAYCDSEVETAKSDIKADFQKFIDDIQNNTIQQAQKASQDATNAVNTANDANTKAQQAVSTANSMNGKITANSVLIQGTNTSLSKITENFGGRNLLLNSAKHDDSNWLVRYDDNHANIGKYMDSNIYRTNTAWSGLKYDVSDLIKRGLIKIGEEYTFNVYIKADTDIDLDDTVYFYTNNIFETTRPVDFSEVNNSDFVQISTTLKVISNTIPTQKQIGFETKKSIDSGYVYFACPQLERGTVATDYTPAPEDIASYQTNLQQQISTLTLELAKLKAGTNKA